MHFHPEKFVTMHLTRSNTTIEAPYTLHGHRLQQVTEAKYLGVVLTDNLKWGPHISAITSNANRMLGFIRRNIKLSRKNIKEATHKTLVRPVLEYGSSAWDPHTTDDTDSWRKCNVEQQGGLCTVFKTRLVYVTCSKT